MKNKNYLAIQKNVVSNVLDRNPGLIIGDTEEVLDLKNQYLIETFQFRIFDVIKKYGLVHASIDADDDGWVDFHFYPLVEIKNKGSGINDILKKKQHLPTAFVCVHDYTEINRRDFDISSRFKKYTSKEFFHGSVRIKNKSICFFPISNNLIDINPFEAVQFHEELDLNVKSFGNKKSEVIKVIKNNIGTFKHDMRILWKIKSENINSINLIKSFKGKGCDYRSFIQFSEELEKKGAKVEIVNKSAKSFESYDQNSEKMKNFKKKLNFLRKQKNKKKGFGDLIKCEVENGIYDVFNPTVQSGEDEYEGKKIPIYNSFIFVIKKYLTKGDI
tara:strand:- start:80 stop:1069 length:990 start_codon:yes stop_codon:yes gene_type:complete